MYKVVLFLVLCQMVRGYFRDLTLQPGTRGRDVVEAVVNKIRRSRVFPDDTDYLRRLAYCESRFGEDPLTYRRGYYGGIWQFDLLKETQHDNPIEIISPELRRIHAAILDTMGFDWLLVKEEDLLMPFYSGLAACIHNELTRLSRGPIPSDIKGQDLWWHNWYNPRKGRIGDFEARVQELLEEDVRKTSGKIDIMMVVDGSRIIGKTAFRLALDSVARLTRLFDHDEAHVGMIVYSFYISTTIPLMHNLTSEELRRQIRTAEYPDGDSKNTYLGMLGAIHSFKRLPDLRRESGVPRLMVVFTDGVHVVGPDHAAAAEMAAKAGIMTCSFGIGDSIDDGELLRIANNDTDFTFRTDYHRTLQEQIVLIARQVKTVPQTPKMGSETIETLKYVGEKRYYRFGVPTTGTTITLMNEEGETRGYWTFTAHQPSSAVCDGVITEGETFIKPPLLLLGSASSRDIVIVFESFANNSRMRIWIDEGDTTGTAATDIDLMLYLRIVIFCSSTALLK